jgi:exodeoxyribonuclease V alpha subunit
MAVFRRPEGFAPFHLDALHTSIEHSFAITVHKSQGSEFDHVALVLPEQEIPILTREILYTAVTRSRKSVVIVGAKSLFASGVRNELERFSGIFERLAGDWERKIL